MINKLITFKLSFRSIVRLLFLFMASNEDLNMRVKKERTFLYFSFLNNVKDLGTIWLNIVGACEKQNKLSKAVLFALKVIWLKQPPFLWGLSRWYFISLYSKTIWLQELNFLCITVNFCVGLSSEREAASTAKHVGLNELIREILIEIAPFHSYTKKKKHQYF